MRMIIASEADRARFIKSVNTVELGKKRFIGEIKVHRQKRTIKQNSLYFMWLACIRDETGNDVDTLHEYFKRKFLPWRSISVFDDEVVQVSSTTSLNTKEFSEYMEKIKLDMINQAIFLPEPGEQGFDEFYAKYTE